MKRSLFLAVVLLGLSVLADVAPSWISIRGRFFVDEKGETFSVRGTNFGHWLNPEGYFFRFHTCNSPRFIDEAFRQLIGPEATDRFWQTFVETFITEDDVAFVAQQGFNTIRVPFHYKLFTDEPYLGGRNRGFELLDRVIGWAKKHGLYVLLDMHDAPGGQSGDNIDDSYGWPWLYESATYQRQFCELWQRIAARYSDEPAVLGYGLMNEPIGWQVKSGTAKRAEYERRHEPLCKEALKAIRTVDRRHIVFFPGTNWNQHFHVFSDFDADANLAYECHSYGSETKSRILETYAPFARKANRPMLMGETGQDTTEWTKETLALLESADIGYTIWSYKLPAFTDRKRHSGFVVNPLPEEWQRVVDFAEGKRRGYGEIDQTLFDTLGDRAKAKNLLDAYLKGILFENCTPDRSYLELFRRTRHD